MTNATLRGLLIVGCIPALSACATPSVQDTATARGHQLARRQCAACHAVEPEGGASLRPRAPAFASLEMRHTAGLEGRVAALTTVGHYDMPKIKLRPREASDLAAYIGSLGSR
jgi:cytochrome c